MRSSIVVGLALVGCVGDSERVVDYNAALRIATLRLTGELPTLAELQQVARRTAYESLVRACIASPTVRAPDDAVLAGHAEDGRRAAAR